MRGPISSNILVVLALWASTALAAAPVDGAMTVAVRESRLVPLSGTVANIVVGDPSVADVALVDSHSLIVLGRGFGTTQLIVTDKDGRTLLDGEVTVVSPDRGQVTLTRGTASTEFICPGERCHPMAQTAPAGGGSDQAVQSPPPSMSASSAASAADSAAAAAVARLR